MPFGVVDRERLNLVLRKDERVVAVAKRNFAPMWIAFALLGMALVVNGLRDPIYGWGVMLIGIAAMSVFGGAVTGTAFVVTDRRLVRTGALGVRDIELRGHTVARAPGAFGETVTVERAGATLRMRHVRNADELADALRA